jgi:squalene synthase HpnC
MHSAFSHHLHCYGPGTSPPSMSLSEARSYCRRWVPSRCHDLFLASRCFPRPLAHHLQPITAFFRWTQGLGDETGGGAKALSHLRWWREELLALYEGKARHPVMIALQSTVDEFHIPAQPFLDLIYAKEQDQLVKRYRTFEQLWHYCGYAAHPIGHLVLYVLGACATDTVRRANDLCTGLQLTYLWQNLRHDNEQDRVYLPEEDRRLFGYADEDLHAMRPTPEFQALMQLEIERARDYLYRGLPLLDQLPLVVQPAVKLLVDSGLSLLDQITLVGYDTWNHRPTLTFRQGTTLLLQTLWQRWRPRRFVISEDEGRTKFAQKNGVESTKNILAKL